MAERIMIVDDDKAYALLIQHKVQNGGYESEIVHHGSDVLRLAMEGYCDLILLDHKMPDVLGSRVCDNLRSEPKLKDMPVIFMSAQELEYSVISNRLAEIGCCEFIAKFCTFEDLLAKVRERIG